MDVPESLRTNWRGHEIWLLTSSSPSELALLFAPTLATAIRISPAAVQAVQSGSMPRPIELRLQKKLSSPSIPKRLTNRSFHLGLGLTQGCSLRCLYCHASAEGTATMSRALLSRSIDLAFERAKKTEGRTLSVSFAVGGEPTYNWPLFTEAVSEFRRLEREDFGIKKVFLSMTTNGYYGRNKHRFVAQHFDQITLSLDGTPEIQNMHRPTRTARDSYGKVADSLRHFLGSRSSLKVGVRATVSSYSVHQLPLIVEFFASEFGGGYQVAFEPLLQLGRALQCEDVASPSLRDFFAAFVAARRVGQSVGIRVTTSGPSLNRLVAQYCGAMALPSFAVCQDGSVTACHRDNRGEDYGYGTLLAASGQFEEDSARVRQNSFRSRIPEECNDCFLKWNCAGDCPDLRKNGFTRCDLNKALAFADLTQALTERGVSHASCQ